MLSDKTLLEYIQIYKTPITDNKKQEIIELIRHLNDEQFTYLLQHGDKSDWLVESEILIALGYPTVKPVLTKLFEWLQDMNWPGALDIKNKLLLKLDKSVLVSCLDKALHQAIIQCDWEWIYWLSALIEEASLSRNDFSQTDNAYDIVLFYYAIYVDDMPTYNYIDLLHSWGYPRIRQFVFYILLYLINKEPNTTVWNKHIEILSLIPNDMRDIVIKEAMRQLHYLRGVNNIGNLCEIIPIGGSYEDFQKYISK